MQGPKINFFLEIQFETFASDEPLGFDCGDVSSMDCIRTGNFSTKYTICSMLFESLRERKEMVATNLDSRQIAGLAS